MKKKIKKEKEGKKFPAKIISEDEGQDQSVFVTRTRLTFINAQNLHAGDLCKHVRIMKVISITHKMDGSADVELEIVRRTWEKHY